MFLFLRLLGAATGIATAGNVLIGRMTVAEFVVADLIIGLLIVAAMLPSRSWAWRGLVAGNAYALGVFTVALARQIGSDAVNPPLIVVMFGAGIGLAGLLLMDRRPA